MLQVKVKNKLKLGENVQKFIRRASNPESLQPVSKLSIGVPQSERSVDILTPFRSDSK